MWPNRTNERVATSFRRTNRSPFTVTLGHTLSQNWKILIKWISPKYSEVSNEFKWKYNHEAETDVLAALFYFISAFMYLVFSGACQNSIHWLFSPSQPFRFYTFMNWGWVVSASTLRWWLLKTLPFAWKLLSATNTMPDFCHESFKVSKYGVYPRSSRWPKGQFGRRRLQHQQCFCQSTILYSPMSPK